MYGVEIGPLPIQKLGKRKQSIATVRPAYWGGQQIMGTLGNQTGTGIYYEGGGLDCRRL